MSDKNNSGLEVVGWITEWDADRYRMPGYLIRKTEPSVKHPCNRDIPLVRLSDAEAALAATMKGAEGLRYALQELLADTQHAKHESCTDGGYCPVRDAREALADWDKSAITAQSCNTAPAEASAITSESVNAELVEALRGLLDAHAIPSSVCKERPAYEAARAALLKAEGAK